MLNSIIRKGFRVKLYNTGKDERSKLDSMVVKTLDEYVNTEIIGMKIVLVHEIPTILEKLDIDDVYFCAVITICETDRIPKLWVKLLNKYFVDEVWVPTQFNMETFAFSGVKKRKLYKVPYPIEIENQIHNQSNNKKFRFLYIADLNPRKNIFQLINAFTSEFEENENVELHLHATTQLDEEKRKLSDYINKIECSTISLSTNILHETELRNMIKSADLYISVDKANGWGMPVMEAMALGVPVSTVNWSGSTEFTNNNNSFLIEPSGLENVPYELVSRFHYFLGHKWAKVDTSSIMRTMRSSVESIELRNQFASRAISDMTLFSMEAIGNLVETHILNLSRDLSLRSPKKITRVNPKLFSMMMFKRNLFFVLKLKFSYPDKVELTSFLIKTAFKYLSFGKKWDNYVK